MPFPWRRYRRWAGIVFVVSLLVSLVFAAMINGGRIDGFSVLVAAVDSVVLATIMAFPLTQSARRGPRT